MCWSGLAMVMLVFVLRHVCDVCSIADYSSYPMSWCASKNQKSSNKDLAIHTFNALGHEPGHSRHALWPTILSFLPELLAKSLHLRVERGPCAMVFAEQLCIAVKWKRVSDGRTVQWANGVDTYSNPNIFHNLVDGQAFGWINIQHSLDEFLCVIADILPFGIRKTELAQSNAFLHARRNGQTVITVKRWEAAQPASKKSNSIRMCVAMLLPHRFTYKMYIITPSDQISQLLSYFSGPNTSGAT